MSNNPTKPKRTNTAGSIIVQLRKKYDPKAYAFLEQVRGGTGSMGSRYCDALVMSLWPSRGFDVEGFEVKVSRSDWLNELKQPAKADEIYRFCNSWWLVAGDDSIVREGELPRTWGLMVADESGLTVKVKAPQLTPVPLSQAFVASVLRCVSKEEPGQERLNDQYQAGYKVGLAAGRQNSKHGAAYDSQEFERLKKSIADFEEKTGIKLNAYNGARVGEDFNEFVSAGQDAKLFARRIESIREIAKRIIELSEPKPVQPTQMEIEP